MLETRFLRLVHLCEVCENCPIQLSNERIFTRSLIIHNSSEPINWELISRANLLPHFSPASFIEFIHQLWLETLQDIRTFSCPFIYCMWSTSGTTLGNQREPRGSVSYDIFFFVVADGSCLASEMTSLDHGDIPMRFLLGSGTGKVKSALSG